MAQYQYQTRAEFVSKSRQSNPHYQGLSDEQVYEDMIKHYPEYQTRIAENFPAETLTDTYPEDERTGPRKTVGTAFKEVFASKDSYTYLPFVRDLEVASLTKDLMAAKALEAGTATDEQIQRIRDMVADDSMERSFGYNVVTTIAESLAFMTELGALSFGNIASKFTPDMGIDDVAAGAATAKTVAAKAAKKGLKKKLKQYSKTRLKTLLRTTEKLGLKRGSLKAGAKTIGKAPGIKQVKGQVKAGWKDIRDNTFHKTLLEAATAAKKGTLGATIKAKADKAGQEVVEYVTKRGTKLLLGGAREAAVLSGIRSPQAVKHALERMIPKYGMNPAIDNELMLEVLDDGEDIWPALIKGYTDLGIEFFSERTGEMMPLMYFGMGGGVLNTFGRKALEKSAKGAAGGLRKALGKETGEQAVDAVKQLMAGAAGVKAALLSRVMKGNTSEEALEKIRAMGWNGVVGEMFEERVGDVMRGATGLQENFLPTPEQLMTEAVAFTITGGLMHTARNVGQSRALGAMGAENTQKLMRLVREGHENTVAAEEDVKEVVNAMVEHIKEKRENPNFFERHIANISIFGMKPFSMENRGISGLMKAMGGVEFTANIVEALERGATNEEIYEAARKGAESFLGRTIYSIEKREDVERARELLRNHLMPISDGERQLWAINPKGMKEKEIKEAVNIAAGQAGVVVAPAGTIMQLHNNGVLDGTGFDALAFDAKPGTAEYNDAVDSMAKILYSTNEQHAKRMYDALSMLMNSPLAQKMTIAGTFTHPAMIRDTIGRIKERLKYPFLQGNNEDVGTFMVGGLNREGVLNLSTLADIGDTYEEFIEQVYRHENSAEKRPVIDEIGQIIHDIAKEGGFAEELNVSDAVEVFVKTAIIRLANINHGSQTDTYLNLKIDDEKLNMLDEQMGKLLGEKLWQDMKALVPGSGAEIMADQKTASKATESSQDRKETPKKQTPADTTTKPTQSESEAPTATEEATPVRDALQKVVEGKAGWKLVREAIDTSKSPNAEILKEIEADITAENQADAAKQLLDFMDTEGMNFSLRQLDVEEKASFNEAVQEYMEEEDEPLANDYDGKRQAWLLPNGKWLHMYRGGGHSSLFTHHQYGLGYGEFFNAGYARVLVLPGNRLAMDGFQDRMTRKQYSEFRDAAMMHGYEAVDATRHSSDWDTDGRNEVQQMKTLQGFSLQQTPIESAESTGELSGRLYDHLYSEGLAFAMHQVDIANANDVALVEAVMGYDQSMRIQKELNRNVITQKMNNIANNPVTKGAEGMNQLMDIFEKSPKLVEALRTAQGMEDFITKTLPEGNGTILETLRNALGILAGNGFSHEQLAAEWIRLGLIYKGSVRMKVGALKRDGGRVLLDHINGRNMGAFYTAQVAGYVSEMVKQHNVYEVRVTGDVAGTNALLNTMSRLTGLNKATLRSIKPAVLESIYNELKEAIQSDEYRARTNPTARAKIIMDVLSKKEGLIDSVTKWAKFSSSNSAMYRDKDGNHTTSIRLPSPLTRTARKIAADLGITPDNAIMLVDHKEGRYRRRKVGGKELLHDRMEAWEDVFFHALETNDGIYYQSVGAVGEKLHMYAYAAKIYDVGNLKGLVSAYRELLKKFTPKEQAVLMDSMEFAKLVLQAQNHTGKGRNKALFKLNYVYNRTKHIHDLHGNLEGFEKNGKIDSRLVLKRASQIPTGGWLLEGRNVRTLVIQDMGKETDGQQIFVSDFGKEVAEFSASGRVMETNIKASVYYVDADTGHLIQLKGNAVNGDVIELEGYQNLMAWVNQYNAEHQDAPIDMIAFESTRKQGKTPVPATKLVQSNADTGVMEIIPDAKLNPQSIIEVPGESFAVVQDLHRDTEADIANLSKQYATDMIFMQHRPEVTELRNQIAMRLREMRADILKAAQLKKEGKITASDYWDDLSLIIRGRDRYRKTVKTKKGEKEVVDSEDHAALIATLQSFIRGVEWDRETDKGDYQQLIKAMTEGFGDLEKSPRFAKQIAQLKNVLTNHVTWQKSNRSQSVKISAAGLRLPGYRKSADGKDILAPWSVANVAGIRTARSFNTMKEAREALQNPYLLDTNHSVDDLYHLDKNGNPDYSRPRYNEIHHDQKGEFGPAGKFIIPGGFFIESRIPAENAHMHTVTRLFNTVNGSENGNMLGSFSASDVNIAMQKGEDLDGDVGYGMSLISTPESDLERKLNQILLLEADSYSDPAIYDALKIVVEPGHFERFFGSKWDSGVKEQALNTPEFEQTAHVEIATSRDALGIVASRIRAYDLFRALGMSLKSEIGFGLKPTTLTSGVVDLKLRSTPRLDAVKQMLHKVNYSTIPVNTAVDDPSHRTMGRLGLNEITLPIYQAFMALHPGFSSNRERERYEDAVLGFINTDLKPYVDALRKYHSVEYQARKVVRGKDGYIDEKLTKELKTIFKKHGWDSKEHNEFAKKHAISEESKREFIRRMMESKGLSRMAVTQMLNMTELVDEFNVLARLMNLIYSAPKSAAELRQRFEEWDQLKENKFKYIDTSMLFENGNTHPELVQLEMALADYRENYSTSVLFSPTFDDVILPRLNKEMSWALNNTERMDNLEKNILRAVTVMSLTYDNLENYSIQEIGDYLAGRMIWYRARSRKTGLANDFVEAIEYEDGFMRLSSYFSEQLPEEVIEAGQKGFAMMSEQDQRLFALYNAMVYGTSNWLGGGSYQSLISQSMMNEIDNTGAIIIQEMLENPNTYRGMVEEVMNEFIHTGGQAYRSVPMRANKFNQQQEGENESTSRILQNDGYDYRKVKSYTGDTLPDLETYIDKNYTGEELAELHIMLEQLGVTGDVPMNIRNIPGTLSTLRYMKQAERTVKEQEAQPDTVKPQARINRTGTEAETIINEWLDKKRFTPRGGLQKLRDTTEDQREKELASELFEFFLVSNKLDPPAIYQGVNRILDKYVVNEQIIPTEDLLGIDAGYVSEALTQRARLEALAAAIPGVSVGMPTHARIKGTHHSLHKLMDTTTFLSPLLMAGGHGLHKIWIQDHLKHESRRMLALAYQRMLERYAGARGSRSHGPVTKEEVELGELALKAAAAYLEGSDSVLVDFYERTVSVDEAIELLKPFIQARTAKADGAVTNAQKAEIKALKEAGHLESTERARNQGHAANLILKGSLQGRANEKGMVKIDIPVFDGRTPVEVLAEYDQKRNKEKTRSSEEITNIGRKILDEALQWHNETARHGNQPISKKQNYIPHYLGDKNLRWRKPSAKEQDRTNTGREISREVADFTLAQQAKRGFTSTTYDLAHMVERYIREEADNALALHSWGLMMMGTMPDGSPVMIPELDRKQIEAGNGIVTVRQVNALSEKLRGIGIDGATPYDVINNFLTSRNMDDFVQYETGIQSMPYVWARKDGTHKLAQMIINRKRDGLPWKIWEGLTNWTKFMTIGFPYMSYFHKFAIGESGMAALGLKPNLSHYNFRTHWRMFNQFRENLENNPELVADANLHGLRATNEHPDFMQGQVNDHLNAAAEFFERHNLGLVGRGLRGFVSWKQGWDEKLWTNFHGPFKIWFWQGRVNTTIRNMQEEGKSYNEGQIKRDAADEVNEMMGSIYFQRFLWATPNVMQVLNASFFAFDWTYSAAGIAGAANIPGLHGVFDTNKQFHNKFRYQVYWPAFLALVLFGIPNAIQAALWAISRPFADDDDDMMPLTVFNEHQRRTYIDITPLAQVGKKIPIAGRLLGPDDGRRTYLRWGKQAYEIKGWAVDPIKTTGHKLSVPLKWAIEQASGRSVGGWDMAYKDADYFGVMAAHGSFLKSRVGNTLMRFTPFTMQDIVRGKPAVWFAKAKQGKHGWYASKQLAELYLGYVSDDQWKITKDHSEKIEAIGSDILRAAEINGFDRDKVHKDALQSARAVIYAKLEEALAKKRYNKANMYGEQLMGLEARAWKIKQMLESAPSRVS